MLKKVTHAAACSSSFGAAAEDLEALAESKVTVKRIERWSERVGEERVEQSCQQAEAYQAAPLPERRKSPTGQVPQVACVMMDGGRIQVRDRHAKEQSASGYWKESLVGCCLSMVSEEHAEDPCPTIPKTFVADGAASNWGVHKKHFSHYTPVLDFTHAVCYVYAAALAGRSSTNGWGDYIVWAQWLWEGAVDKLIAAVEARSKKLGQPPDGDETSPAAIVARTHGYLKNQRSRMKYDQYRRLGLPNTSSHVESTIKQLNRRVKGTEKFWSRGAEPMLQLAADHLSETNALARFWKQRPTRLKHYRCYQTAV